MEHTLNNTRTEAIRAPFSPSMLLWVSLVVFVFGCEESMQTAPANTGDKIVYKSEAPPPLAYRLIKEALTDPDPIVRVNAIEVVAATRQIRLIPKVQRLLNDPIMPVRFAAAVAIGDLQYALGERSIREHLKDPDQNVKIACSYAMTRLGYPEYTEVLNKAILSDDQTVRANAALLLGRTNKDALKFLYWAMRHKDSDDKVVYQAAESIARLGDERIYPKLWTMLISAYADVRVTGIRAMGALGTESAKNALITMLDDDVLEVRLAAAGQLGMLGEPIGEPEVLDVFEKNLTAELDKQSQERVNLLTALAIGQIGTTKLTKYLPQLLRNESKIVRVAAAKAVLQRTPELPRLTTQQGSGPPISRQK